MGSVAEPVRVGPFTGGLNTYSDAAAIADEDAASLVNFDVALDGSLISRPPIVGQTISNYGANILGVYSITNGESYLIYACTTAAGAARTSWYRFSDGVTGDISTAFAATAMVQYLNKAYLVSGGASSGGSWDGTTFTAISSMPKGVTATIYKERMFIGTGRADNTYPSRMFYSASNNPGSWTGTDNLDILQGDGQSIVKVYSFSGTIIVFKNRSTYSYAYESAPTKGQIQAISSVIGIDGPNCLAESEGVLYVMSGRAMYSIQNWNYEQISIKSPFKLVNTHGSQAVSNFSVSTLNNRIICRYYDTYYVFGTKTRAWTTWRTNLTPDFFVRVPNVDPITGAMVFYAGNFIGYTGTGVGNKLFTFQDEYMSSRSESMNLVLATKVYNMNVPYSFKRLMWWGVDLLAKSLLNVTVTPITYGTAVRWMDVSSKHWSDLAMNTWGNPQDISLAINDSAQINNPLGTRMFVKFIKSLRFRQIQFQLNSTVDGTPSTSPLNIYSFTAMVANKQLVTRKIN